MQLLNKVVLLLLFLYGTFGFSQEKITISGTISDKKNNETLIGVSVAVKELKAFTTTNEYGFYSLTLPKGDYEITISYVGYESTTEKISLTKKIRKDFQIA